MEKIDVATYRIDKAPDYRWIVGIIIILDYVAYFSMYQMLSALGTFVMQDMGIGSTQLTGLTTAGMIGMVIGPCIGGKLRDMFGSKKVICASMGTMMVVSSLYTVFNSYGAYVVLRFIQGFCMFQGASCVSTMNAWFPKKQAGVMSSILLGVIGVGFSLASAICMPFMNDGATWQQTMMYTSFILCGPVFLLSLFFVRDLGSVFPGVEKVSQILESDLELERLVAEENAKKNAARAAAGVKRPTTPAEVFKYGTFWAMMAYAFIKTSFTYGTGSLFPLMLSAERGLTTAVVASVTSKTFFISVFTAVLGGWLSAKFFKARRAPVLCIGAVFTFLAFALIPSIENLTLLNVMLAICYGSTALGTGIYWSMTTEVTEPEVSAFCYSMIAGLGNLGGVIVPLVLAALAEAVGSYSVTMYILAALAVVQFLCMVRQKD